MCADAACRRARLAPHLRRIGALRRGDGAGVPGCEGPDDPRRSRAAAREAKAGGALVPAARADGHASPRVAPTRDATRVGHASADRRRRRCRLEQPRMRQGRPDRCRHPPPLLLLHAHALCLGLRVGEAAVPDGCATRGPPTDDLVPSLGSGDRRQGRRVRCHLDGRRRANRTLLRPFGAGDLPTGSDRPVHARRGALGRVSVRRPARRVQAARTSSSTPSQDCGSACWWSARDTCFPLCDGAQHPT